MKNICDICGKEFEGYGNNPAPLDGNICCDICNKTYVIPARLKKLSITSKLGDAGIETPQITELRKKIGYLISEEVRAIDDYDEALKTVDLSEDQRKTLEEIRNDEIDHTNKLNEIYKSLMTGEVEEDLTEDASNLEESFAGGYDPATINTELETEPNVQDGIIETVSNVVEKIGNLSTAAEDDEQDVQKTLKENEISSSVTDAKMTVDRMIQIITPIVSDYAKKKDVEDYWKIHKNGKNVSVGMELGYRDMDKLCDILNAKLAPLTDSYFEPADAGLIETTVFDSAIRDESDLQLLKNYFSENQPNKKMELRHKLKSMGYEEGVSGVNNRELMWVKLNGKKYEVRNLKNVTPLDNAIKDSDTVNDIGEITVGSKYRFEEKYGNQPLTVTELGETVKLSLDNSKTYLRIPREKFEDMVRTGRLDNTDTTTIKQYGEIKAGDRKIGDFKSDELVSEIRTKFNSIGKSKIEQYVEKLKAAGGYKDLITRLVWDLLHATTKSREISDWYDKYDVNDNHITNAGKDALRKLGINL